MDYTMKAALMVCLMIAFPVLLSAQDCNDLEGAWLLVYLQHTSPDTTYEHTEFESDRIKVLAANHFAFGVQGYQGDPDFAYAGGGTFKYSDDKYSEFIHYHSSSGNVGHTITFDCRVEDDRWYHEGLVPMSITAGEEVYIREIWERID